jgi:hypothetical protein
MKNSIKLAVFVLTAAMFSQTSRGQAGFGSSDPDLPFSDPLTSNTGYWTSFNGATPTYSLAGATFTNTTTTGDYYGESLALPVTGDFTVQISYDNTLNPSGFTMLFANTGAPPNGGASPNSINVGPGYYDIYNPDGENYNDASPFDATSGTYLITRSGGITSFEFDGQLLYTATNPGQHGFPISANPCLFESGRQRDFQRL